MLIQKLSERKTFAAGDGTKLRELLHPDKQPFELEVIYKEKLKAARMEARGFYYDKTVAQSIAS
ncbi:MAG: hypothetical protein N4J56_007421 [Chroococcidiopsis sp. SAG 2025]|nr:hypothetical protein [Chroococcidiopsis sp. SAG 2025]MDV2997716.1 hypothetical protein [Chroococcidiopsis sp. SAG 2025]